MEVFDILMSDYDLQIADGDLVVGESTRQHQDLLMLTSPGERRQYPVSGVGLNSYLLDDSSPADIRASIQREFEADGMRIHSLSIDSNYNISIAAEYV